MYMFVESISHTFAATEPAFARRLPVELASVLHNSLPLSYSSRLIKRISGVKEARTMKESGQEEEKTVD